MEREGVSAYGGKQGFYKIFMFVKIDKKFLDDFWNIHEKKIKKFF